MDRNQIRVLFIEDDEDDYLLTREHLSAVEGTRYAIDWRRDVPSGLEAVRADADAYDVCLLDYRLGSASGLDFLHALADCCPNPMPVLFLTGLGDRRIDMEAMKAGAADYLEKNSLTPPLLERAIRYARERHANLKVLARKNQELAALNEQKNEFVGMAAHDLRNPLANIRLIGELMLDEAEDLHEEHAKLIHQVHGLSEFMLKLVNDMLDLAQIEAGKLALQMESTDVRRLVLENLDLHARVAERKGVELIFEAPETLPPVSLDAAKIQQVLNNLIDNAISFSEAGKKIWVTLRLEASNLVISVRDEGPGIPEDERAKLFKPFELTSVKAAAGKKSTGLGLAIARKIVSGHGGQIGVESQAGAGSVFSFTLPVRQTVAAN